MISPDYAFLCIDLFYIEQYEISSAIKKLDFCNQLCYTVTNLLQIVIFTEEYMTKRLLTSLLALILVFGIFPTIEADAVSENTSYNSDKALKYASAHWNDGKGLCAEFVSDCLSAGDLPGVYNQRVVNLYNALIKNKCGKSYKLVITDGSIKETENPGKIKKGDPIFFYCNVCKEFTHVSLCNGFNSDGYAIDYSHNNPHDGNTRTYTYPHCGTSNWTMYSVSMYNKDTLFGTKATMTAPKISSISNAADGVCVKWNKVPGAEYYRVYRKTANSGWSFLSNVNSTSYTDKKARDNVKYTYTVRACKDKTYSQYYSGSSITHLAILKLKSIANQKNSIKVTWNINNAADGYYIYRQVNGGKWYKFADIKNGKTTSYTDKKVSSGNTYCYRVRSFKGSELSSYERDGIKATCLVAPKLTSVVNINEGICVKWGSVAGATNYRVYRKAAGEKSWTYLSTTKGNSYTDTNVQSSVTYKYTVRAMNGKVLGSYDSTGLEIKCVSTPTLVGATYTGNGTKLLWKTVTGATGYYVYHKAEGASKWTRIAVLGNVTSYLDTIPEDGSVYYYTVRAINGKTTGGYYKAGLKCICDEERGMQVIREQTTSAVSVSSSTYITLVSQADRGVVPTTTPAELTTVSVTEPYTG